MNAKLIFVFATLGVFLACSVRSAPQPSDKSVIDDLFKKVKEAIEKLMQEANEAVNKAIQQLQDLINKVIEEGSPIIDQVKQAVQKFVEEAQGKIKELQEEAEKLGVNVQECVQGQSENIQKLVDELTNSVTACVQTEIDTANKMINDDINVIKEQMEVLQGLPAQAKECMDLGFFKGIQCLGNMAIEIAKTEKDMPAKITQMVAEATQFVSGLEIRLEMCATRTVADASVKVAKLTGQVAKCIHDKISESGKTQ